jgi:integral membrane protein (TIGR01906 family)
VRILLSLATAITILAVALVLLLTPIWTHFALGAADSTSPAGDPAGASDRTVWALVTLGRFDFPEPAGPLTVPPLYSADEQAHMRDVQAVFYGFMILAVASLTFVVAALGRAPRDAARLTAVGGGGIWLIAAMVILGVFAFAAFDTAFTLFHEVFFPGGNWAFPADSNLIRLYPEPFWELSAAALGILASIGGVAVWYAARRRAAALG